MMLHVFNKCLCLNDNANHTNMFGEYAFTEGKIYDYELGMGDLTFFIKSDDNGNRIHIYRYMFKLLTADEYREIKINTILK